MPTGAEQVETLRDQVECPQCQYSLRGLGDGTVTCPECGTSCDIAQLITQRWAVPWNQAPGLSDLTLTVVFTLMAIPGLGMLAYAITNLLSGYGMDGQSVVIGMIALGPTGVGWIVFTYVQRRKRRPMLSFALIAQAHFVVVGYLTSMVVLPIMVLISIFTVGLWSALITIIAAVLIAGIFTWSRRTERHLAETCIRLYLHRTPRP